MHGAMKIKPFQGLRPQNQNVDQVASLPYDVVSTQEARELAAGNPHSFLHVVRAEIDLPEGTDPYDDSVYEKARENFQRLQQEGHLVREQEPCMYLYRQEWRGLVQEGIATTCHIGEYENDTIKKHEKTRVQKENDRLKLNQTLQAHPGPVFLTYREDASIEELMEQVKKEAPLFDFAADDGVKHTVWSIPQGHAFVDAFAHVPAAYVADGHHRAASAWRLGKEKRENNPEHHGDEPYNWFLAVLFPANKLNILPYNRIVKDFNGLSPEEFLEGVKKVCTVYENNASEPEKPGQICMFIKDRWFGLERPEPDTDDPVSRLDVAFLQSQILSPILNIQDPRTSDRVDFVGGIRGTEALEQHVQSGEWAAAFSLYPVTVDQLMDISDANEIMPPKSTWFEPKLRSGLFIHTV